MDELGFVVQRETDDVLIRDSDQTEWTSGRVWARSAPETVVTMLADAYELCGTLVVRLEAAQQALEEISNPIPFMRKRAEQEGGKLNGQMAVALSDDANFLKSIAREAIGKKA